MSRVTHSEPGLPMVVFERIYSYLRLYLLATRLPELVGKTRLLALIELRAQEQAFN